jgi:hypothetical protein
MDISRLGGRRNIRRQSRPQTKFSVSRLFSFRDYCDHLAALNFAQAILSPSIDQN